MKKTFMLLACGTSTLIIAGLIFSYRNSMHHDSFNLNKHLEVSLKAKECLSCFRDWKIDFEIEIKNTKSNQHYQFDFSMGQGPYIQFKLSNDNPEVILIEGYGPQPGIGYLINLEKNSIEELSYKIEQDEFYTVIEMDEQFETMEKST